MKKHFPHHKQAQNIGFTTDALPSHPGRDVIVSEDSWDTLVPVLDSYRVRSVEPNFTDTKVVTLDSLYPGTSRTQRGFLYLIAFL